MEKKIIGICEGSKYSNYENWIKDPQVEIIRLGYKYNNIADAERCDGIILTGGDDVSIELYTNLKNVRINNAETGDKKRDEFEWKIMELVEEKQKPLLAICRGLQFVNVFYGGSLLPDLPDSRKKIHSKLNNGNDRMHIITLDKHSMVYHIVGEDKGMVSSGHHQCVSEIAGGLKVTAMSPDGVVEALEKRDNEGKTFFLLIQWHPERTMDKMSVLSKNIRQAFLEAVIESR